jgi:tetratricopeptide (TPR) repeat protein
MVLKRGMACLHRGESNEALADFRLLIEDGIEDARIVSYYGLLIGTVEGKVRQGLDLCDRAVAVAFFDADVQINLARLHLASGWRSRAIAVLLRAIRLDPGNPRLLHEIRRINPRAKPPLSFLRRSHPLNKYLGLTRARLSRLVRDHWADGALAS